MRAANGFLHPIMSLQLGQVLRGRAAFYKIAKILKAPTVFQAQIVPSEQKLESQSQPQQL